MKGDVARITLYMIQKYRLTMPLNFVMLMRRWNLVDPVTEQERMINRRIQKVQGDFNPFVGY